MNPNVVWSLPDLMIVALILIFERPFSGATKLSAEPFRQVAVLVEN
jgi:hypothetical protein